MASAVTGTSDSFSSAYIGAYLKQIRMMRGVPREDVAAAAGVSVASITNYESGKINITLQSFLRICIRLDVDPVAVLADIVKDNNVQPYDS